MRPEALYDKLRPGPGMAAAEVAAHQRARILRAMVEAVAKRGYGTVTVRELVGLAGVSTRTFYKHFDSKEECFLCAHESVVRRTAKRIVAAQAGESDWRERSHLAFAAFADSLVREPQAAHLALVDVYAAGPAALRQVRRAERTFEAIVAESFARDPDGFAVPPPVIEGIVAGLSHAARSRLLEGDASDRSSLGDALMDWTLCHLGAPPVDLAGTDRRPASEPVQAQSSGSPPPSDDFALMLSAVVKLAVGKGFGELTVPRIRVAAGVSKRRFDACFEGVEDCFFAALEQQAGEAFAQASLARAAARSWQEGVALAIAALCQRVGSHPSLAKLYLVDVFESGPGGIHCHRRLVAELVELLYAPAPPEQRPPQLAAEASAAAIWGLLSHRVASGQSGQLSRLAPTLASLALAPASGKTAVGDLSVARPA